VTREEVLQALGAYLRGEFGKMVVPRGARLTRRVTGGAWKVAVVVPLKSGDVPVAELEIDEDGNIVNAIEVDAVAEALRRPTTAAVVANDGFADAAAMDFSLDEEEAAPVSSVDVGDADAVYARAQALLATGDSASLHKARVLMPRLLSDADKRGAVLVWMAVIERKLGQIPLALGYLEAACREFADRFDVDALEKAVMVAKALMEPGKYTGSTFERMLDTCRERMKPIETVFECPQFFAADQDERDWLGDNTKMRKLATGDTLVKEGEPSKTIFVIKSGLIGVHLEKPEGGTRLVRCCFPGWMLGESSVLVADDPRCTATLRAEQATEVWGIDGSVMREVMKENEALQHRIAATKQLHRIDSFFSMHETVGQLEVQVRDEMLGCIERVQTFDQETTLVSPEEPPKMAGLVARGEIAVWGGPKTGDPAMVLGEDRFFGVRDALHAIPASHTIVARPGSTITFFNADLLRQLGERSPEHVVAVLERLG
jgi:Cyclic nucleotide-binding domain